MGKRFDHVRTVIDEETANRVIDSVKEHYGSEPSWVIGESYKKLLSDGKIQVTIELTKLEPNEVRKLSMKM